MIGWLFLTCIIGYVLGSVPFALVIGKVFFKKDIRTAGSGNLGGGNAGRVLGAKAGLAVMILDILKVTLSMFLSSLLPGGEACIATAGFAAAIGHCFPVFAGFRGGKAVATLYGFLFGLIVVLGQSIFLFLLPLAVFLLVLYFSKITAVASVVSSLAAAVVTLLYMGFGLPFLAIAVLNALIIWRHRANFHRIRNHVENKVRWL